MQHAMTARRKKRELSENEALCGYRGRQYAEFAVKDARRIATQVMLGTAALVMQTDMPFEDIKALTPMQTVDEAAISQVFLDAARGAHKKIEQFQKKLSDA